MTDPLKLPPPPCRCEACVYFCRKHHEGAGLVRECRKEEPDIHKGWPSAFEDSWCGRWLGLRKKGHESVLLNYPTACELWANGMLAEGDVR